MSRFEIQHQEASGGPWLLPEVTQTGRRQYVHPHFAANAPSVRVSQMEGSRAFVRDFKCTRLFPSDPCHNTEISFEIYLTALLTHCIHNSTVSIQIVWERKWKPALSPCLPRVFTPSGCLGCLSPDCLPYWLRDRRGGERGSPRFPEALQLDPPTQQRNTDTPASQPLCLLLILKPVFHLMGAQWCVYPYPSRCISKWKTMPDCNPSTWEVEAGGIGISGPVWAAWQNCPKDKNQPQNAIYTECAFMNLLTSCFPVNSS